MKACVATSTNRSRRSSGMVRATASVISDRPGRSSSVRSVQYRLAGADGVRNGLGRGGVAAPGRPRRCLHRGGSRRSSGSASRAACATARKLAGERGPLAHQRRRGGRGAFLWRLHRVHHSDPSFTVSTGVRFHPGELLLALPVRLAAVVLLGGPVVGVLVGGMLTLS